MDEIILLPAAFFFLVVGLYNLYNKYKKSESYIPVIAAFLMFIVILVMYFDPVLGSLFFFLSMIIMASKWPVLKQYQEKRILVSFKKNDYSEELKLKDYFTGTKIWGKFALDYGAKKAAFFYSLWIGGSIFIFLNLMRVMNSPIKPSMPFIAGFSSAYLFFSYYQMHGYFKKFLAMKENVAEKID